MAGDLVPPFPSNCYVPIQTEITFPGIKGLTLRAMKSELQLRIDAIFAKIQNLIPNVTFSNFNRSTSGRHSRAFIVNPRRQYCVGEDFVVQFDMYDHQGNRKTYGGDFIRSRLISKDLGASVSGTVKDFSNGSYQVIFPLYWVGEAKVSTLLWHPSEGIAALWRARHSSQGFLGFQGKFEMNGTKMATTCGLLLDKEEGKEICAYEDTDYEEAYYCFKVPKFTCESLTEMRGFILPVSYLTPEEVLLFQRSNIAVEIPINFAPITVAMCSNTALNPKPKCQTGMSSPFPSGYFFKNTWNPVYCNMTDYKTAENFTTCLQGKKLFLIGDSTLRQFIMHFTAGINLVNYFRFNEKDWSGWEKTLLAMNMEKDLYISYRRHGFPLEHVAYYNFKDDMYMSRQIDQIVGGKDTIIVITFGQHFRHFPLKLFIRRALNIRRATERLFLRSPDTKVIIKSENTRQTDSAVERQSDFHGYTQYLVLRDVFQGLNVGFVDAWDMTVASGTANVHPVGYTLTSIMSLTFTFAC
ncbi:NXPE family member 2-like isoform X2 [Pseudophryne corroboree]|uniref:NXPE family member 2-like isoform X2 n=1 Tax=Pseudophryne corroboree TaxID=495146 RepID=UPI00308213C8